MVEENLCLTSCLLQQQYDDSLCGWRNDCHLIMPFVGCIVAAAIISDGREPLATRSHTKTISKREAYWITGELQSATRRQAQKQNAKAVKAHKNYPILLDESTARIELANENGNTPVKRKSKKWKCFSTEFKFICSLHSLIGLSMLWV